MKRTSWIGHHTHETKVYRKQDLETYIFLCRSISCNRSSSSFRFEPGSSSFLFTIERPNRSTLGERDLLLEYLFFLRGDRERRRGDRSRLFLLVDDGVALGERLLVRRR